jgi:LacI family transcriptional regulator
VVGTGRLVGRGSAAVEKRPGDSSQRPPLPEERLVPPLEVVARQSSDVLRVDDADVAAAIELIRRNACHGITMTDVTEKLAVSRSTLERRFRKYLGHSPKEEIRAVRLARIRELLTETDLSLAAIARRAGYEHPEYMSVVFKRETGQTPGEYRQYAHPKDKKPQDKTANSQ